MKRHFFVKIDKQCMPVQFVTFQDFSLSSPKFRLFQGKKLVKNCSRLPPFNMFKSI